MVVLPITTSETDFAAYLILSGFELMGINYEPRSNNRKRGIFVFPADPAIDELKRKFESGQTAINLNEVDELKKIKSGLLDRVMQGLP